MPELKCAILSLVWHSSFSCEKKTFLWASYYFFKSGKNPFGRHCTYFEFYTQTNVTKDLRLFQEFYTLMQMYSKSIKKSWYHSCGGIFFLAKSASLYSTLVASLDSEVSKVPSFLKEMFCTTFNQHNLVVFIFSWFSS